MSSSFTKCTAIMSPLALRLAAILILVLCRASRTVGDRSRKTQDTSSVRQRAAAASCDSQYASLFKSTTDVSSMESRRDSGLFLKADTLFELNKDYKRLYSYTESCVVRRVTSPAKGYKTVACSALTNSDVTQANRTPCKGCCETEMSISVPGTVTNLYNNVIYTVKHFTTSYQLLNLGHCASNGAQCGNGGRCTQAYRMQWVLVVSDSGDMFVPTSIPSHCTCVYI